MSDGSADYRSGEVRVSDRLAVGTREELLAETVTRRVELRHWSVEDRGAATGSICGNLIGAQHGSGALPLDWMSEIEGQKTLWNLSVVFAHELSDHS